MWSALGNQSWVGAELCHLLRIDKLFALESYRTGQRDCSEFWKIGGDCDLHIR